MNRTHPIGILALVALLLTSAAPTHAYEARLNCGGFATTTQSGDTYDQDRPWSAGGSGWTIFGFEGDTWQPIGGTEDQDIYRTLRGSCAYRFDVPDGWYIVTLHITDFWSHGPRQNQYDVLIEGAEVISDLDVFAEVGKNYAVLCRFALEITDGSVDITTNVDRRHAYLSGIAVVSVDPDTIPPPVPANVEALSSYGRNSIVWDPVAGDDVAGYKVYRRFLPSGPWVLRTLSPIQVSWYQDRSVAAGQSFSYRVSTVDVFGNESVQSDTTEAVATRALNESDLPLYEILMSQTDLDALNTDDGTQGDEYFPGTFVHGSQVFQNVGIRYRGFVTRKLPKKSWKVRFNAGEAFGGGDRLNLNGEFPDMSLLREYLGYQMYDATRVPRSRSRFVNVSLNGDYLGIANSVQQVDEYFLSENGLDPDGSLYKAFSNFSVLPDSSDYIENYEKKTNEEEGYGDLITLIETVNAASPTTFWSTLIPVLDIERAIEWYSVNVLLSNLDFSFKNYYLYHDLDRDYWTVLPWDMDYTFGKTLILDQDFQTQWGLLIGTSHRLVSKMTQVPALRRKHLETLVALANDVFTPEVMDPRIDAGHALLAPSADIDWLKFGWEDTQGFLDGAAGLKSYVVGRRDYVLTTAPGLIQDDGLVINEFMARNDSTLADEHGEFDDWVEITNGSAAPIDLTGMYLTDDPLNSTKWEIPSLVIAPGGYALFWADGDTTQGPMHMNFQLDGDGEWIGLFASTADENIPRDFQRFGPQQVDVSRGRTPDGDLYWSAFGNPSPGAAAGGPPNAPPTIEDTDHTPTWPTETDPVLVTTRVSDDDGVLSVHLHVNDGVAPPDTLEMFDDGAHGDGAAGDGTYGLTISPRPDGTIVTYFVRAVDAVGIAATDPISVPVDPYLYEVGYSLPQLVINEFLASNLSVNSDEMGEFDDWVEIHNVGETAVNLAGMTLTDNLADSTKWSLPDYVLGPAQFVLVWCDDDPEQGPLHATFKLSASGEELGLFERPSFGGTRLDALVFGEQRTDISYGRYPDGSGPYQFMGIPTPGAPNEAGNAPPVISDVWLSPNPAGDGVPVLLTTEIVDDGSVMNATAFYNAVGNPPNWIGVTLWDDGAHGDGGANDRVYGATLPGFPTGTEVEFYVRAVDDELAAITEPVAGPTDPYRYVVGYEPPVLFVNELMAINAAIIQDEAGEFDDWIELYNGGPDTVELGGMYLTDNLNTPLMWAFPDTSIGPGEFLIVWADQDPEQGPLHTNFRLGQAGEEIGLFDTIEHFHAVIDSFPFGAQSPDVSYGRYPDGEDVFVYMTDPTPGASNMFVSVGSPVAPPPTFALTGSAPNPFTALTTIRYSLERTGPVWLRVFDVQGRLVRTLIEGIGEPGTHRVVWNGLDDARRSVRQGVYFVRLESGGLTSTQKLVRYR